MVGVFVTLDGVDRDTAVKVAEEARHLFEGMSGLRFKIFTVDEEGRRARNVYVWDSDEAARVFFSDELVARITSLYGVAPTVEFAEIAQIVDNSPAVTRV